MDSTLHPVGIDGNLRPSNAFTYSNKVPSETDHCVDTTLRLESLGCSTISDFHRANKRKMNAIDRGKVPPLGFSLGLGFGGSPSSSVISKVASSAMSSVKESQVGSPVNLELDFQLHLGSNVTNSSKKISPASVKVSEMEPLCDLQLSLSAGPSTSVITNASTFSNQNQNNLGMSVSVNVPTLVDEGSTSSCWKSGISALPPHLKPLADNYVILCSDTTKDSSPAKMQGLFSVSTQMSKCPATCTSETTHSPQENTQLQHNTRIKICQFPGCGKGARGASGLCIAHGGGKRCQTEGCHKGAEGRTPYCKAHGGGRRCQSVGCTKSAEGRTNFCIAHGGGRRCNHEGCTRAARGKSGLCIRHGGGKRCQKENCTKSAEGYSGFCISHGGGRRCHFPSCSKGAQGSTMFCKAHGGGKRCTAPGCTKGAEGRTPFCKGHGGGKRCSFHGDVVCPKSVHGGTQFCVAHGGGKRCVVPGCTKSARGRTDFCVRHGGGKRCKSEGCGKSAQGCTDFCKAHGGGKRCLWVSELGNDGPPCDKFARGKTGLCTAHSSMAKDNALHKEGSPPSQASVCTQFLVPEQIKKVSVENFALATGNHGWSFCDHNTHYHRVPVHPAILPPPGFFSLTEGRVHGGSLMAMLELGSHQSNRDVSAGSSVGCTPATTPCKWI